MLNSLGLVSRALFRVGFDEFRHLDCSVPFKDKTVEFLRFSQLSFKDALLSSKGSGVGEKKNLGNFLLLCGLI